MVSNEVEARRRHKGSKFFHELNGLENHVGGTIAPAALEAIEQPAVRQTDRRSVASGGRPA